MRQSYDGRRPSPGKRDRPRVRYGHGAVPPACGPATGRADPPRPRAHGVCGRHTAARAAAEAPDPVRARRSVETTPARSASHPPPGRTEREKAGKVRTSRMDARSSSHPLVIVPCRQSRDQRTLATKRQDIKEGRSKVFPVDARRAPAPRVPGIAGGKPEAGVGQERCSPQAYPSGTTRLASLAPCPGRAGISRVSVHRIEPVPEEHAATMTNIGLYGANPLKPLIHAPPTPRAASTTIRDSMSCRRRAPQRRFPLPANWLCVSCRQVPEWDRLLEGRLH